MIAYTEERKNNPGLVYIASANVLVLHTYGFHIFGPYL